MSKMNPQKATAYVGKGVLRKGGKITPVPNGPLIKKKGIYAGSTLKSGGAIKKAQTGETIKGSRKGRVFKTTKERTTSGGLLEPYKYTTKSIDTTGYSKGKPIYELKSEEGEGDKTFSKSTSTKVKKVTKKQVPSILKDLNKGKNGNMIKRADGSFSKRGLWDNLRSKAAQNKKTGAKPKAPTKAMLTQEKRIKAKK